MVDCVIAGGGPAGAMLGLLLARAGCVVVVLEKHADFLRDFRGDTLHPSTLETLDQIGLAEDCLRLPHVEARTVTAHLGGRPVLTVPFERLRTRFPFIALVPQWDFLDLVTGEARRYPNFCLVMEAEVTDLLREDGQVVGVRYRTPEGERDLRARLTVGADGRSSRTRELAGLEVVGTSPPMDVLWFRISRRADDPIEPSLRIGEGHLVALLDRGDYWQCAHVVRKGADPGVAEVRETVAALAPFLADRVGEIGPDALRRLTVRADRLRRWYAPGFLAIGDAAHAMSPVGGVGINVAIQDAVAAANALWKPLRNGRVTLGDLRKVQRRRAMAVRLVQAAQEVLHRNLIAPTLARRASAGRALRLARIAARPLAGLVGLGPFRPRVRSPSAARRGG